MFEPFNVNFAKKRSRASAPKVALFAFFSEAYYYRVITYRSLFDKVRTTAKGPRLDL